MCEDTIKYSALASCDLAEQLAKTQRQLVISKRFTAAWAALAALTTAFSGLYIAGLIQ